MNEERNQNIVNDYLAGLTRQELADKYNMSCVGRVLKESGIKFGKKGGKRRKIVNDVNRKWIDKQILALTRQGFAVREIMQRYAVTEKRIAKVKAEAGMLFKRQIKAANAKNVSEIPSMGDTQIPYGDNCNVRPKRYSDHYSQIIFR